MCLSRCLMLMLWKEFYQRPHQQFISFFCMTPEKDRMTVIRITLELSWECIWCLPFILLFSGFCTRMELILCDFLAQGFNENLESKLQGLLMLTSNLSKRDTWNLVINFSWCASGNSIYKCQNLSNFLFAKSPDCVLMIIPSTSICSCMEFQLCNSLKGLILVITNQKCILAQIH